MPCLAVGPWASCLTGRGLKVFIFKGGMILAFEEAARMKQERGNQHPHGGFPDIGGVTGTRDEDDLPPGTSTN